MNLFDNYEERLRNRPKAIAPVQQVEEALDFEEVMIDSGGGYSPRRASRFSDRIAIALVLMLGIAPIAYGAARPLAWIGMALAIGILSLVYFIGMQMIDKDRPMQVRAQSAILLPGILFIAYACFQILPVFSLSMPVAALGTSKAVSLAPSATFFAILRLVTYAMIFVLMVELGGNRDRVMRMARLLFYVFVCHAIFALVSFSMLGDTLLFQEKTAYQGYATGTFVNRNSFATFMAMGLILGLTLAIYELRRPRPRAPRGVGAMFDLDMSGVMHLMMALVIFAALLSSGSRLGLASAVAGSMVAVAMTLIKSGASARKTIGWVGAITVVSVVLLVLVMGRSLADRLVFALLDSDTRIELYRQTWDMILTRPWTGFGLDSFPITFPMFHQPDLSTSLTWDMPHDTYLTLWAEAGFIFGSLPMIAIVIAGFSLVRRIRERERAYAPSIACVGIIIDVAIHSLGDFSLEISGNTYIFVALMALGLARRAVRREPQ